MSSKWYGKTLGFSNDVLEMVLRVATIDGFAFGVDGLCITLSDELSNYPLQPLFYRSKMLSLSKLQSKNNRYLKRIEKLKEKCQKGL